MSHRLAAFVVSLATTVVPAVSAQSADEPPEKTITGHYQCAGEGYQGRVVIRQMTDETYRVFWKLGAAAHVGAGIRKGEMLCVGFASAGGTGAVIYDIEDKKLTGKYCSLPGDWKLHSETLTYVGPLRTWEPGDKVLANQAQNGLWHPATISKKEDDRYLVKFSTGEESITSSRIAADNINVGYVVLVNQGVQNAYVPGQVTRRDGEDLEVQLPNGQRMPAKLSQIAVQTLGEG